MGVESHGIDQLQTPALVFDLDILRFNIDTMASLLPGARLRPHMKATKCTSLAKEQLRAGHTTFTCATPNEMIGMAHAGLGNYLLGKYKNPVLRFTGLSTQMSALSATNQNIVLNLDMTSICTVVKNFVVGTPATETQTLIVSGIAHNITPGSHIVSYTFESTDGNQYLTLDDAIFGTLDNNLLSF